MQTIKDKKREEVLCNGIEPEYKHLKDTFNFLVKANPPFSNIMLAVETAEIKKMLVLQIMLFMKLIYVYLFLLLINFFIFFPYIFKIKTGI